MSAATVLSRYGTVQVTTSSPGQVLVMLYDGLFRFVTEAQTAMRARDRARAGERIGRAHAILDLLASTIDPSHSPALADNLVGLYRFCMAHLIQANVLQDPEKLAEVTRVLAPLREAWREVVAAQGSTPPAAVSSV